MVHGLGTGLSRLLTLLLLPGMIALLGCGDAGDMARAGGGGAEGMEGEGEPGAPGEGEGEPSYCDQDEDCPSDAHSCVNHRCIDVGEGEGEGSEPLPPEEVNEAPQVPVVGERYLFLAIPGTNALAAIDTESSLLGALPLTLPGIPVALATLPGRDVALVLGGQSQGQRSTVATLVRAEGTDEPRLTQLLLQPGFNALAASDAGLMVAFTDHDLLAAASADRGNLSEVALIDLRGLDADGGAPPVHHLSVGTRPRRVEFSADGEVVLIVTDDGVSRIEVAELQGDGIAPPLPLHPDALASPAGRRVILTPDGRWAVASHVGENTLRLIDLTAPPRRNGQTLALDAEPTDLVLLHAQGHADRLLVVLRASHQALIVPLPGGFTEVAPQVIDLGAAVVGQAVVDAEASRALLFSTASGEPLLLVLDLTQAGEPSALQAVRLDALPTLVQLSPSGDSALVLHDPATGIGFSMVALAQGSYAKPFATSGAEVTAFTFTPADAGSERLVLGLHDAETAEREVLVIPTESFIAHRVQLRAAPVEVGVIPASRMAFVTQDDPEGLISFIHLEDDYRTDDVARFRQNRRVD